MPAQKLKEFLEKNNIKYESIEHPITYSANMTAHVSHVSGKKFAKTVIIKVDGDFKMVVVPASQMVRCGHLKKLLSAKKVEIASENEFVKLFPDCEPGAMPPFGNLYGLEEYVSDQLSGDIQIAFNAGTHTELMQMKYSDFERLVHPRKINLD